MSDDDLDCFDHAHTALSALTEGLVAQGHDPFQIAMALCRVLQDLGYAEDIDVEDMLPDFADDPEEPADIGTEKSN